MLTKLLVLLACYCAVQAEHNIHVMPTERPNSEAHQTAKQIIELFKVNHPIKCELEVTTSTKPHADSLAQHNVAMKTKVFDKASGKPLFVVYVTSSYDRYHPLPLISPTQAVDLNSYKQANASVTTIVAGQTGFQIREKLRLRKNKVGPYLANGDFAEYFSDKKTAPLEEESCSMRANIIESVFQKNSELPEAVQSDISEFSKHVSKALYWSCIPMSTLENIRVEMDLEIFNTSDSWHGFVFIHFQKNSQVKKWTHEFRVLHHTHINDDGSETVIRTNEGKKYALESIGQTLATDFIHQILKVN